MLHRQDADLQVHRQDVDRIHQGAGRQVHRDHQDDHQDAGLPDHRDHRQVAFLDVGLPDHRDAFLDARQLHPAQDELLDVPPEAAESGGQTATSGEAAEVELDGRLVHPDEQAARLQDELAG